MSLLNASPRHGVMMRRQTLRFYGTPVGCVTATVLLWCASRLHYDHGALHCCGNLTSLQDCYFAKDIVYHCISDKIWRFCGFIVVISLLLYMDRYFVSLGIIYQMQIQPPLNAIKDLSLSHITTHYPDHFGSNGLHSLMASDAFKRQ